MSAGERSVTVIIPTVGRAERAELLQAAIESVVSQIGVEARPLVVLNGPHRAPEVEARLRRDPRVTLLTLAAADLPAALRTGRAATQSRWFATLDDDDLLLPGALEARVRTLESRPDHAVVVTNGYRRVNGRDLLHVEPGTNIDHDPLAALLDRNWLLPGSWLCRSDAVDARLFDGMPRYLECTYLGIRFATEYRMLWVDEPTVVYREGSPMAESESRAYTVGQARALRRILALELPASARRRIRRRIADAHHSASDRDLASGALRDAWRWHIASLAAPGGWRFLPYTRHLLLAPWRRSG